MSQPAAVPPPGAPVWAPPPTRHRQSALPTEPADYPRFWRGPRWRFWRPLVAVVLGTLAFLLLSAVAAGVGIGIDVATGRSAPEDLSDATTLVMTPALFLANNVSLALLVPIALLLSRWPMGQRGGWLSSVVGRLRWGWLLRCLAIMLPLWLLYVGITTWLSLSGPDAEQLRVTGDTWILLAGILLTTPFQAAGEEYAFRGVLNRGAGGFFRAPAVALVVGLVFSSVLFMLAHGAGDLWLNIYYFCFGAIACLLTWRTGGIEAAIAMHVVNNVLSELVMPFTDISDMFDRQSGVGDPSILVMTAIQLVAFALVEWQARRRGLVRATAPGLHEMAAPQPLAVGSVTR